MVVKIARMLGSKWEMMSEKERDRYDKLEGQLQQSKKRILETSIKDKG